MGFTPPTVSDFKTYFNRDFPYGASQQSVMDTDITRALQDAGFDFPENLFSTPQEIQSAYLLLSAHHLVMNLRASSQGVSGRYDWLSAGRGVGSVNESYNIPQKILDNPFLAMLSKTNYGAKYLMMIAPRLMGQIFSVGGATTP